MNCSYALSMTKLNQRVRVLSLDTRSCSSPGRRRRHGRVRSRTRAQPERRHRRTALQQLLLPTAETLFSTLDEKAQLATNCVTVHGFPTRFEIASSVYAANVGLHVGSYGALVHEAPAISESMAMPFSHGYHMASVAPGGFVSTFLGVHSHSVVQCSSPDHGKAKRRRHQQDFDWSKSLVRSPQHCP